MNAGLEILLVLYIYVQIMFIVFIAACLIQKYRPTWFHGLFQQDAESKDEDGDIRINIGIAWPLAIIALIIYGFWSIFHTLIVLIDQY